MSTQTVAPKSWREIFKVHPAADVFPMMSDAELDELAKDIKAHGLREAVVMSNDGHGYDFILDGRNRLEALTRLGATFDFKGLSVGIVDARLPDGSHVGSIVRRGNVRSESGSLDPVSFVISANIHRRHLTKEQKAELIVRAHEASRPKNDSAKVARSFSPKRGQRGGSTKDAVVEKMKADGKQAGLSSRTIERARAKVAGKVPAPPPAAKSRRRYTAEDSQADYKRTEQMWRELNERMKRDTKAWLRQTPTLRLRPEDGAVAVQMLDAGYKKMAVDCHPDRGGSPEDMVRLNGVRTLVKQWIEQLSGRRTA